MMKPPKFKPHFNRALGKRYDTAKEYYGDMKKLGLEPYNPQLKKVEAPAYARSEWAKGMLQDIVDRKGRAPGDRFIQELAKRGINHKSYEQARRLAEGHR